MWFVFILESQGGTDGRRKEKESGGLHSHTLCSKRAQGLLSHAASKTHEA